MDDRATQHRRNQRTRDRALILLVLGVVLLLPPIARVFQLDGKIGGIPIALVYVFAVWGMLIAGTFLLARRLREADGGSDGDR